MLIEILLCIILGYALGCINFAYYYAKLKGGNIFTLGSSNAGATNIARAYGLKAGIITGVLDGLKMILVLFLVNHFLYSDLFLGLAMLSCLAGHIYPVQLGFNGGKGAASLIGAGFYLLPWQSILILFALFFIFFFFLKNYKKSAFLTMLLSPVVLYFYIGPLLLLFIVAGIAFVASRHLPKKIKFKIARSKEEFRQIAKLNYQTFVEEIPQHHTNKEHLLVDKLHEKNTYIIAKKGARVIAMVALNQKRPFSLDAKISDLNKYLPTEENLCEVRLLSIVPDFRKGKVLAGLIIEICKYVLKNKVEYLLISATTRELKMYRSFGFKPFYRLVGKEGAWYQPMILKVEAKEISKWNK